MIVSQRFPMPKGPLSAGTTATPARLRSVQSLRPDVPSGRVVGAEFSAQSLDTAITWVGVRGEIDIRNASALASYTHARLQQSRGLILDLTMVEFFGAAGLEVFDTLNECALTGGTRWVLIGSRPVQRLLNVADPERRTPFYPNLELARSALERVA